MRHGVVDSIIEVNAQESITSGHSLRIANAFARATLPGHVRFHSVLAGFC